MRNVIFAMNTSIDGCHDHNSSVPTDELYDYFINMLQDVDMVVYGRKTYELMFPYWSDMSASRSGNEAENRFADTLTSIDRIVFSKTIRSADAPTQIMRENLEEEIQKLKLLPGKKISISSVSLFAQLLQANLIDEFNLVIHPVMVGSGKRLFDEIGVPEKLNFKLMEAKVFKRGHVGLHYLKHQ